MVLNECFRPTDDTELRPMIRLVDWAHIYNGGQNIIKNNMLYARFQMWLVFNWQQLTPL